MTRTLTDISESIVHEFHMGTDIPYLYGMRLWLPKGIKSADMAKYISMSYPYQVHAREDGINQFGEELPTLSISAKKDFEIEEIFREITIDEMAKILINAYQAAEKKITHLRSVRFWLPQITDFTQTAEYIEKHYSDYQAHTKDTIRTPQGFHLPSLVIGSKKIIK